jgi:hypothetical protein
MAYKDALAREFNVAAEARVIGEFPYPPKSLVFHNSKCDYTFRSPLTSCGGRTETCMRHCYACRGNLETPTSILKTMSVNQWICDNGYHEAARWMAADIPYKAIFRWMDRGDLTPLIVDVANQVLCLREDIKFCAYSRRPILLSRLYSDISKVLSLDKDNVNLLETFEVPGDWKVAYLKTEVDEEIPDRVDIVHPLNKRKALLGDVRDCSFAKDKKVTCRSCMRCWK